MSAIDQAVQVLGDDQLNAISGGRGILAEILGFPINAMPIPSADREAMLDEVNKLTRGW